MNMRQLEYLAAVVAHGSYEKAAAALYITPQAIAKSIKGLEKELGSALATRHGRSIQPTEFALVLAEKAQPLLQNFAELERFATIARRESAPVHARLGIATIRHRAVFFTLNDLEQFKVDNPNITLETSIHTNEACFAGFDEGMFDAVVVMGERMGEEATVRRIATFDTCVLMAAHNPLASQAHLTLQEIKECPIATPLDFIRGYMTISARFAQEGITPHFVEIEPAIDDLRAFLDKGGIAFIKADAPSLNLGIDIARVPLEESNRIEFSLNLLCSEAMAPYIATPLALYLKKIWKQCNEKRPLLSPE